MVKLYPHQVQGLKDAAGEKNTAFYWDMGTGKTYVGAEKMHQFGARVNLVVCQKSKIDDWMEHFTRYYSSNMTIWNLTDKDELNCFLFNAKEKRGCIGIINYDLVFRRSKLLTLTNFTLMLDESSLIQNERAKRSKFILKMKPDHVILLSGTPTGGKYEKLYSQLKLLGMPLSKTAFYNTYIEYHFEDYGGGARVLTVDGYKNVDRLKRKMRECGCHFLKSEDVLDLPDQIFTRMSVPPSKDYRKFRKDRVITVDGVKLMGDTTLTRMLYERQLCGQYNKAKLEAFKDLVESTSDRLIVFYNFTEELSKMISIIDDYANVSVVNGFKKDLRDYEYYSDSITFIQYQAGAMGLNLQKANKIIYFSPPLSSELYEQSKKRINRIGQAKTCYYYNLVVKGSIEEKIYKTLEMRKDYTEKLFESEGNYEN